MEQPPIEQAKVRRSGTSLVITIPAHHVQRLGVEEGNIVNVNWWSITKDEKQPAGGSQSKMSNQNIEKLKTIFIEHIKENPGCTSTDLFKVQPVSTFKLGKLQVRYFVSGKMKELCVVEKGGDGKLRYWPK
jgi:hypothetical protein